MAASRGREGFWEDGPAMQSNRAALADVGPPAGDDADPVLAGGVQAEVGGSLARVAQAVDMQRQLLERDLHDGVQQRLVAVRIRLGLASELANGDARLHGLLFEIGESLDDAIEVQPQVLTDFGLVAALAHVAGAAAGPVDVASTGLGRHPAELESAIYYCCCEAIQNATRHCGSSVRIAVVLHEDARGVGFDVSDDGPGFDLAKATAMGGIQHMRDRIALLGGRLSIVSQAGVGTVVSGLISLR
jgi:signal transduction histidine kinase